MIFFNNTGFTSKLQQYLPFTVLKLVVVMIIFPFCINVATALTVYGIETLLHILRISFLLELQQYLPFTVLKRFYYRDC